MINWRLYVACFAGAFCATALFLLLGVYAIGSPVGQTILAAHGILVANNRPPLTVQQQMEVVTLLRDGYLISADGLISSMSSFYENLVTVLLGSLVFFGIFSYVGARIQTKLQIDEVVAERVEHGISQALGTKKFDEDIKRAVASAIELEIETLQTSVERLQDFVEAQQSAIAATAASASPEENEE